VTTATQRHPGCTQDLPGPPGATVWFTGLPSAGKTTLATAVADRLRRQGRRVEVLDGDAVRATLSAGLGFSRADRDANVERIGFVAELLARNGVLVLAAVISPYAAARQRVRERHEASRTAFVEVHVATPLAECAARDVKGLYARSRSGEVSGLTGVDDPYEEPADPDLRIDTVGRSTGQCADAVLATLAERGLL
jgi:adenylylsulfate kinase